MRTFVLAVVGWVIAAAASAQPYNAEAYDGRAIPGWTYAAQANLPLPTWMPAGETPVEDGANCNVGFAALTQTVSREEWLTYFNSVTPQSFAASLSPDQVEAMTGYRTDVITVSGRPALRNLLGGRAAVGALDFLVVSIGGATTLVTVTCTTRAGRMLARTPAFDAFINGLAILAEAPK